MIGAGGRSTTRAMAPRFLSRDQLLADLDAATVPGAPLRLLFVFRLAGIERLNARVGDAVAEVLIRESASTIAQAIGPRAAYYRSRRDELCGLVAGDLFGMEEALVSVLARHNTEHEAIGLTAGLGVVVLPREAASSADAIALTDRRVTGVIDRRTPVARRGSARGRIFVGTAHAA